MRNSLFWLMLFCSACGPSLTGQVGSTTLQICRTEDPIPNAVDDERSLCLSVKLASLEVGSVTVDGTAALTNASDATTLVFTPAASNSSRLTSAMASASCFAAPSTGAARQQLKGTILIDSVTASGVDGVVNVALSGAMPGANCGFTVPTSLAGPFHLSR